MTLIATARPSFSALAAIHAAHRALGDRLDDLVAAVEDGAAEVLAGHATDDSSVPM